MPSTVQTLVLVLVIFQVKHLLADFTLQTQWMYVGKEALRGWFAPLAAHAGVHAAMTLAIVLWFNPALWWLAAVDFVIHGTVDRGKGVAGRLFRVKEGQRMWWQIFGLDQMLHHLTHLALAVAVSY
jgi:hypothetical protein